MLFWRSHADLNDAILFWGGKFEDHLMGMIRFLMNLYDLETLWKNYLMQVLRVITSLDAT